jgi:hypothetical protein
MTERQSLISTTPLQQVCIRFTSSLHQEYYKSTSKDEKEECKMKNVKCKKEDEYEGVRYPALV